MKLALPRTRATLLLLLGFATFLVALVLLVASSLVRRSAPAFDPTPVGVSRSPNASGIDTLTIDARDDRAWRFVDLARGVVLAAPDAPAWDLAVRRHDIGTSGAIADAGTVRFDAVHRAPARTYLANSEARDTVSTYLDVLYNITVDFI